MSKIALYCCNYGNYRNELRHGLDKLIIDPKIDCFFYTDIENMKSERWKIKTPPFEKNTDRMNHNYRQMAKKTKFITPMELSYYDIIIYIDSKYVRRGSVSMKKTQLPSYDEIIRNMEKYDFLCEKHPWRTQIKDEINCTIRKKLENKEKALTYYNNRKKKTHSIDLIETGYIIRQNNERTAQILKRVYDELFQHDLKRDQNVFNYVLDDMNFPKDRISLCL